MMKKLFSTSYSIPALDIWLLIFRITSGAFMLTHGIPKLNKLLAGGEIQFADPFGLGSAFSLALAVLAEFVGSILIILGLATRIGSILLMINMIVALLHVHINDDFAGMEKALLFLIIFTTFLFTGAGKYSVDHVISGR